MIRRPLFGISCAAEHSSFASCAWFAPCFVCIVRLFVCCAISGSIEPPLLPRSPSLCLSLCQRARELASERASERTSEPTIRSSHLGAQRQLIAPTLQRIVGHGHVQDITQSNGHHPHGNRPFFARTCLWADAAKPCSEDAGALSCTHHAI